MKIARNRVIFTYLGLRCLYFPFILFQILATSLFAISCDAQSNGLSSIFNEYYEWRRPCIFWSLDQILFLSIALKSLFKILSLSKHILCSLLDSNIKIQKIHFCQLSQKTGRPFCCAFFRRDCMNLFVENPVRLGAKRMLSCCTKYNKLLSEDIT